MKKAVVSALVTMSLLLTACGGSQEGTTKVQNTNKDTIFKEERDVFQIEEGEISQLVIKNDTIYVEQYSYNYDQPQAKTGAVAETAAVETAVVETAAAVEEVIVATEDVFEGEVPQDYITPLVTRKITGFLADGTVKSQFVKEMEANSGAGQFTVDADGNIYSMIYKYATYEDGDTTDDIYLEACSADGIEKWKIYLNENTEEGEYFYANSIQCDDKGQIILDTSRGIEIYDAQGAPVKMINKLDTNENRLLGIRDGKFAVISSDGNTANIQTVDIQSGNMGEKVKLPFNYYRYQVMNGNHYDIYLSDDYGVYGYNIGDEEITKLMDYISSDFSSNYLYQASFVDENTFVAYYYEEGMVLAKFTKVAPEDVIEKTELVLGCYYIDHRVKEKLIDFNKKSQEYRLNIRDYSVYDTMEDYTQGLTRLNTDIISGDVPDIMILNTQMPFNSYVAKGVFADINTFLEKDTEIKKEDFLPNVLEVLASADGLYRIAPSFSVNTFAAKTADVGEEAGWTMEEALEVLASKPEGTKLLSEMTASNFMYYTMWICGEQYVDWNTGECYFDSEGFQKMLEYANTLPREIDYTAVMDDQSYWEEMETQYRDGKTILSSQYISCFRDYASAKQATFGEDITLIGFPVEEGVGAGFNIGTTMAISALGKNQEVAWEFVKSFLTKEYQDSLEYDFPIRIDSLQKLEERAWEKPYFIDEEGNKEEYDDYFYINGVDVPAVPLTKEETGLVMDYIKSLDKMCAYNEDLNNIVTEETESYFAGQKSAKEVAEVIQSRAKIYVNENR